MKKLRISFDGITEMRKFENSLSFVGVQYTCNDELLEIEIEKKDLEQRKDLEIKVSTHSTSISFRNN